MNLHASKRVEVVWKSGNRRTAGFTLVELLVVIAIIGILVALLLPAVQAAREAARRSMCSNNFKQVGLGLQNYADAKKAFPPGTYLWQSNACSAPAPGVSGYRGWGWASFILPFIEEGTLYDRFDFRGRPIDVPSPNVNFPVTAEFVKTFLCPSEPQGPELVFMTGGGQNGTHADEDCGNTNMAGIADSADWTCNGSEPRNDGDGMLFNNSRVRFKDVLDGTSHTLIVGEAIGLDPESHQGFPWVTWNTLHTANGINTALYQKPSNFWSVAEMSFSSHHPGGCHFVLVDGSVRFINESVSPTILKALTTRSGHEIVGEGL
jgi:prepilin-type N-terminal cleavage/methylation domain-containing protein